LELSQDLLDESYFLLVQRQKLSGGVDTLEDALHVCSWKRFEYAHCTPKAGDVKAWDLEGVQITFCKILQSGGCSKQPLHA